MTTRIEILAKTKSIDLFEAIRILNDQKKAQRQVDEAVTQELLDKTKSFPTAQPWHAVQPRTWTFVI